MANIASNRSPSPLSSRNCRSSEMNSTTRRSFSGNPFARPTALTNPRSFNPPTPANSPATTDHTKRHSIGRKSIGNSMFQDGKENLKDAIRSRNFMAPTISAASKFTPSPRKKVLGEKNEPARTSIQFLDKDSDLKSETTPFDQTKIDDGGSHDSTTLEQKEVVVETLPFHEVTLNSKNDSSEMLSEVTETSDFVNVVESSPPVRPFCCSPQTSPIIAPLDDDHYLPPYDPKKNFLSPRPQFLRYKPNPRIKVLLNKVEGDDDYGDEDVTRLQDSFDLSDNSSDHDQEEEEEEEEKEEEEHQLRDSINESPEKVPEMVAEEKKPESEIKKTSKPRFFTRSKAISLLSLIFLIACFSVSLTDSPPMDLTIYKDISFSEIYLESLKFAVLAKESFDDFAENLKQWSIDLLSYLSHQKTRFSSTGHEINSIHFFNLTTSPPQEDFLFNRHVGTGYRQKSERSWEFEEEMEDEIEMVEEEEAYQDLEVDDDSNEEDDVEIQEPSVLPHEHIQSVDDDSNGEDEVETDYGQKSEGSQELEEEMEDETEMVEEEAYQKLQVDGDSNEVATEEPSVSVHPHEHVQSVDDESLQTSPDLEDGSKEASPIPVSKTESSSADSSVEVSRSETLSSLWTRSISKISTAGFSVVVMMIASVIIIYMNKTKSSGRTAGVGVSIRHEADARRESCSSGTSSIHRSYNKKPRTGSNKRESLASSSEFSMGSPSYGSFTTYERIPIKHGDEEMLTPIRRSSRLLRNQVTSS